MKLYEAVYKTVLVGYKEVEADVSCRWCGGKKLEQGDGVKESLGMVKCLDCGRKTDLYEVLGEVEDGRD